MSGAGLAPRLLVLSALVGGLGASPFAPGPPPAPLLALAVVAAAGLWWAGWPLTRVAAGVLAAAVGGLWLGTARVEAIDSGALTVADGATITLHGFVDAVPRRQAGEVRVRLATREGRVMATAREPVADLPVGHEVRATGTIREPADWERAYLRRLGIARVLETRRIELTGAHRAGLPAFTDRLRERAERALGEGTPEPQAALLRGFVLGQDDRIDPQTVEDFQRSGLAHLLAVSGQNVVLLALLAGAVLGAVGVGLRGRLLGILGLIAVYVPMAGAGASIQRAGVMGAAGVVAALASRPASRWYALLLAAAATLALNPRASGDVGWQLSFAAVIGIAAWAGPLRLALSRGGRGGVRAALAEGAAVTVAATVATAPLMAHHFERLSVASLGANLLALPAVAPVMWLGMMSAAVGQLPWLPAEPFTAVAGIFAGYITQIAAWTGAPAWAQFELGLGNPWDLAGIYLALLGVGWALERRQRRRLELGARPRPRAFGLAAAVLTVMALLAVLAPGPPDVVPRAGLVVRFLDVGQGDSVLLQARRGPPLLVDTGPVDGGAADRLRELGIDRLAAVVITHADSDHAGGLEAVLAAVEVRRVVWAVPDPGISALTAAAGARGLQLTDGATMASGGLRLDIQWPPRDLVDGLTGPPAEPNALSLVALARWRGFRMLLPGDGEAEAIRIDPGPLDVLKLAHHGSDDAGLGPLLDRTGPELAVASVGAGNTYGHPTESTAAAVASRGIPLARTDQDGEVVVAVGPEGWAVLDGG